MNKQAPKRKGTAFWLADQDGDLLRAVARAEDRPIQTILRRALVAYADQSPDYRIVADLKPKEGREQ